MAIGIGDPNYVARQVVCSSGSVSVGIDHDCTPVHGVVLVARGVAVGIKGFQKIAHLVVLEPGDVSVDVGCADATIGGVIGMDGHDPGVVT
uniref:Uncharacterized protein n=1 Tax=Candidatus Kentrum sp. TUN TaxID=2126343 RepID=A0A451A0T8_9GAMM|nr:MAG: hypothetical protein BECKTUN1418F_GA0071002_105420 [Candidatus Kentron sp. TUN]VFK59638.1 MAG: hypothetical protein BECKTUN1418E_GA0071001_105420 [Candidatus Kentron sp. TUN]